MGIEVFEKHGAERAKALRDYFEEASRNDYFLTYVIINPQAERAKDWGEQKEELVARIVDEDSGGITIRGAKMLGTSSIMGIDVVRIKLFAFGIGAGIAGVAGALYAHQATYIDSTTFNVMMSVEILTFVVVGGGSTYWGPVVGAVALSLLPQFLRTLREWLQLVPVAWTDFYPMNKIYDFLYAFLDFENAKRLIAYGLILIVMMIVRPDGLITRDSLARLSFKRWRARHA